MDVGLELGSLIPTAGGDGTVSVLPTHSQFTSTGAVGINKAITLGTHCTPSVYKRLLGELSLEFTEKWQHHSKFRRLLMLSTGSQGLTPLWTPLG